MKSTSTKIIWAIVAFKTTLIAGGAVIMFLLNA